MFKNVAVVGLGLIGGSFAKVIKEKTDNYIIGFDIIDKVCSDAKFLGVIDEIGDDDNISKADIIIVALHPKNTVDFILKNLPKIKNNAIVIDVCGVKKYIVDSIDDEAIKYGVSFIGCHPMAGREFSGFEYSSNSLFEDASMIITPQKSAAAKAVLDLTHFLQNLGFNKITVTTPKHHDEMIAFTSQLAHVVSSSYIKSPEALMHTGYSAGSYKDLTRVARLDENMWTELFIYNKESLVSQIDQIILHLGEYKRAIESGNEDQLRKLLREGKERKENIG